MPAWPLDDFVLQEGYDEQLPDNVIRTPTDLGPGKRRPRSTAAPTPLVFSVPVTTTDAATLESFFKNDCSHGALYFDWKHPRTGAAVSMAFTAPPRFSAKGALYIAKLEVEILV